MGWTYSGNPAASPLDEVRFLIGDTDPDSPQLQDEEINYWLVAKQLPVGKAAINCVSSLIAKVAPEVDYSIGPESVSAGDKFNKLVALKQQLEAQFRSFSASLGDVFPHTGSPIFTVGMTDNPPKR